MFWNCCVYVIILNVPPGYDSSTSYESFKKGKEHIDSMATSYLYGHIYIILIAL